MGTGAITQYVDVAQLVLYLFWIFFAGLVYYLLQENHRDGYPLDPGTGRSTKMDGWPPIPSPKTYKLANGEEVVMPYPLKDPEFLQAQPRHRWIGAPIEPTGNPLLAGVGPGSWNARADHPDVTPHGEPKISPLRANPEHAVAQQDIDPRGLPVQAADLEVVGRISDMWVDAPEQLVRYLEIELNSGGKRLVPMTLARIWPDRVRVRALASDSFAGIPQTKSLTTVTKLEEDKISGYVAGGWLYDADKRKYGY